MAEQITEKTLPTNSPKREKSKQKQLFVPNREAYDRINYLYQAAQLTLAQNPKNTELSRFYISTAKKITNKLVLKIDPQVKKTICKCCHALLVPGITSKQRLRGKREKHMVITCTTCNTVKRWRTNNCSTQQDLKIDPDEQKTTKQILGKS